MYIAEPNDADKEKLINMIKRLSKTDHLYIYELIKKLNICTVGKYNVVFDLNNVPKTDYWIIADYVRMTLDDKARQEKLQELGAAFEADMSVVPGAGTSSSGAK